MSDIVCMYIPTSLYHKETVFEKKNEYPVVEFKRREVICGEKNQILKAGKT